MTDRILFVSGFGRCGTSMVMRMLHAGGVPVYAQSIASYEHSDATKLPLVSAWLRRCRGRAVKLLDPQIFKPPKSPELAYDFLWLDRDTVEQGRSQAKFMRAISGVKLRSDAASAFADSYRRDRPKAMALMHSYPGATVTTTAFETILDDPQLGAELLAGQFGHYAPKFDVAAAAAVVIGRPARCQPDLSIEFDLIRKEDAAR